MDIRRRGIGVLIDDLITTSLKIWHIQDDVQSGNLTNEQIGEQFKKIQTLNVRRNALINELDKMEKDVFTTTEKNYS